ncbi:MAG TPA: cysteine desulfurase, partial [Bacteroidetes bacterium]|nr:cysteine desulfurase [Bacteroidota bacterium]
MSMRHVYLDNAASTPMDPEVLEHMVPFLLEHHGNPSSVHHHGRKLRAVIEKSRKEIAALLGAAPAEIFFTSGGTEADNMALKGCEANGITHFISTRIEHHAVTHPLEAFEKKGKKVSWIPVDETGHPDLEALERALAEGPRAMVCLMHANNEVGTILDMEAVAKCCQRHDAIFHSDTVQSMANVKFNLAETPVQFLAASAHKFYGPKGIGFLYMRSGMQIPAMLCGGSQERNLRAGTENVASIAAMAFSLGKCYANFEKKNTHLSELKQYLWEGLKRTVPGIQVNGTLEPGKAIPTVLNVAFPSDSTESMLLFNLDINGISASGGSACTSGSVVGSHVLAGMGHSPVRAANSVRFSFGM